MGIFSQNHILIKENNSNDTENKKNVIRIVNSEALSLLETPTILLQVVFPTKSNEKSKKLWCLFYSVIIAGSYVFGYNYPIY